MMELTKKTRALSLSDRNRRLLKLHLPPSHPLHAPIDLWDAYSTASKLLTSYVLPLLEQRSDGTAPDKLIACRTVTRAHVGIAFPSIYIVPSSTSDSDDVEGGQKQGRLSVKRPAAQTYPKPIKKTLASRYPDGCIVSYDFSQLELRVAGVLSGDPSLLDAFAHDRDLHTDRAVSTFGRDRLVKEFGPGFADDPVFKDNYRQPAKHGNFTDLNLGNASTLQVTILKKSGILVPYKLCAEVISSRPDVRPGLFEWQFETLKEAAARGMLDLPFTGQSRFFGFRLPPDHVLRGLMMGKISKREARVGQDINEAVNFKIQCIAASATLQVQHFIHHRMPALNALLPPVRMFMNVYDAAQFDTRPSWLPTLDALFAEAVDHQNTRGYWRMICDHYGHDVPLRYDRDILTGDSPC